MKGWIWVLAVVVGLVAYSFYVPFNAAKLKGLRVLITGASAGIGEEIAYFYCKHGANVVLVARNADRMKAVVSKCKKLDPDNKIIAEYIKADLANTEDKYFQTIIDEAVKLLGGLDTLVLNHVSTVDTYNEEGYYGVFDMKIIQWMFQVNAFSYFSLANAATNALEQSSGKIVVVGSAAGKLGLPNVAQYSATKHAIFGYFDSLRHDFRRVNSNITITSCVIGSIDTENARWNTRNSHIPEYFWHSKQVCAETIAIGAEARLRDVYYPMMQTYPMSVLRAFPSFTDFIVAKMGF